MEMDLENSCPKSCHDLFIIYTRIYEDTEREKKKKYLLLLGDLLSELGGLLSDCLHSQPETGRFKVSEEENGRI